MASRVAAGIVLIIGIGVVLWVALGGNDTEVATPVNSTAPAEESVSEPAVPDNTTEAPPESASTAPDTTAPEAEPAATPSPEPALPAPENFGPRMNLVQLDGWLNTDATSIDDFNGQVLVVEMWTFGCHNCKARIPYNQSYYEEFGDDNFEIIGVHAPEFSYEADVANIVQAAQDLGVDWPIALDTTKKNFRSWQPGSTNFWPRTFVVDQNGDVRYDHIGEGKYEELRETIRYLLENPPEPTISS